MSGSREKGVFPRKHFSFNRNFLTYYAHAAFNWVLTVTTKKLKIARFFASLPFLTYLCNKRLKPSIRCVQLEKNSTDSAGVE